MKKFFDNVKFNDCCSVMLPGDIILCFIGLIFFSLFHCLSISHFCIPHSVRNEYVFVTFSGSESTQISPDALKSLKIETLI